MGVDCDIDIRSIIAFIELRKGFYRSKGYLSKKDVTRIKTLIVTDRLNYYSNFSINKVVKIFNRRSGKNVL